MASLQELLSRSVTQTLGLSELLEISQQRAERTGQAEAQKGQIGVAKTLSEANEYAMGKQIETAKVQARSEKNRGIFGTIMALGGGLIGGFGIDGIVKGGGLAGASTGSKIGSALSGGTKEGELISGALGYGYQVETLGKEMKLKEDTLQYDIDKLESDEARAKAEAEQKQENFQLTYDQKEREILNKGGTPPKTEKPDPQIKIQAETDFRGLNDEWGVKFESIKNPEEVNIKGYEKYKELSSDLLDAKEELERTTASNHEGISASLLASRRKMLSQYINNAEAVLTSKNLTKGWGIGNVRVKDKADKPDEQVFEAVRDGKYDVLADLIGWTPKYEKEEEEFEIGKIYQDDKGSKAKYLGSGKWGKI